MKLQHSNFVRVLRSSGIFLDGKVMLSSMYPAISKEGMLRRHTFYFLSVWLILSPSVLITALLGDDISISSSSEAEEIYIQSRRWPSTADGVYLIPYVVDVTFSLEERQRLQWVIEYMEQRTNLHFMPHSYDMSSAATTSDVLIFKIADVHKAALGWQGGAQFVFLQSGHVTTGALLHMILHSLGFGHVYQRPDRDLWVHMMLTSSKNSACTRRHRNFAWGLEASIEDIPYDYASILHHGWNPLNVESCDNRNGTTLFKPVLPRAEPLIRGQRSELSSCDIFAINTVYSGEKQPGYCIPHQYPGGFSPTEKCLAQTSDVTMCFELCMFNNDKHFVLNGGHYCKVHSNLTTPSVPPGVLCSS